MINIGIIILNYLAYKTTIETLISFIKQDMEGLNVKYIVVDNCSNNKSFEKLVLFSKNYSNVYVYKTEKNLGFAKGNNFGYQKLLELMKPDYTIISNDDILLPQQGLYNWISNCYKKYRFAVLGPDIYSINGGFHQSPSKNKTTDLNELNKEKKSLKKSIIHCYINKILKKSTYNGIPVWENNLYKDFSESLTLHGSFQIFSKEYFKYYKNPYDDSTFLYMEEDILKLRCDKFNLKMIYEPSYQVEHLQAVSTNMVNNTMYQKELFRYKNLLNSLNVYISLLENNSYKNNFIGGNK